MLQFGAGVIYIDGADAQPEGDPPTAVRESHGWFPQASLRLIYEF